MSYFKHIDGIRAIAVLSIILFHSGLNTFKGGFIGVDVFFVISGFLITGWILKKIKQKKFSLKEFFSRRIKRLMPVLFFIKVLILISAFFLMNPYQLFSLIKQLLYSNFFLSNIFLWKNSDYFSVSTFENPIIHTWSLSLEEQFYLVLPFFILVILKFFNDRILFILIIIIAIISIFIAQMGGNFNLSKPYIEENILFFNQPLWATYFMPFGRIWEFLLGSIIFIKFNNFNLKSKKIKKFLGNLGLILIIFPIFVFDENNLFPSIYTLVPVIGTIFLILFFSEDNFFLKILSTRLFIYTGLISYSLYLWHQPLFAFYKILFYDQIDPLILILIIFITYFLSMLTFKYLETPIRKSLFSNNFILCNFILFLSIFSIILSVLNSSKYQLLIKDNYKNKIPIFNQHMILDEEYEIKRFKKIELIDQLQLKKFTDKKKIIIIGDSMATNWIDGINNNSKIFKENFEFGHHVLEENCFKYLIKREDTHQSCRENNDKFLNSQFEENLKDIEKIYLVSGWTDQSLNNLNYFIKYLGKYKNKLIVVGNAKFSNVLKNSYNFAKDKNLNYIKISKLFYNSIDTTNVVINKKLSRIATNNDVEYLDEYPLYCSNYQCQLSDESLHLFLWDSGHLTKRGAIFFGKQLYKKKFLDY
tara:strand:+ start:1662 stop:3596 length:1935 start_codon:yes stop_codon:yes gene_type:complete